MQLSVRHLFTILSLNLGWIWNLKFWVQWVLLHPNKEEIPRWFWNETKFVSFVLVSAVARGPDFEPLRFLRMKDADQKPTYWGRHTLSCQPQWAPFSGIVFMEPIGEAAVQMRTSTKQCWFSLLLHYGLTEIMPPAILWTLKQNEGYR